MTIETGLRRILVVDSGGLQKGKGAPRLANGTNVEFQACGGQNGDAAQQLATRLGRTVYFADGIYTNWNTPANGTNWLHRDP
jgi:hypothetical protein